MDIVEARSFAREKVDKDITYRHLVSVEGVMRRLGRYFDEDEETWQVSSTPASRSGRRRTAKVRRLLDIGQRTA